MVAVGGVTTFEAVKAVLDLGQGPLWWRLLVESLIFEVVEAVLDLGLGPYWWWLLVESLPLSWWWQCLTLVWARSVYGFWCSHYCGGGGGGP